MLQLSSKLNWPDNVWMGVTVETDRYVNRMVDLSKTPANVKFVSMEPLLGPIYDFPVENINWIIVGGESGPKSRPMKSEWVTSIRDRCLDNNIAFFFKQWGGVNKKKTGRTLEGKLWSEMPQQLSKNTLL